MIYRFSAMCIKISMTFFAEGEKYILKLIRNLKGHQIAKRILEKKNNVEALGVPDFKTI